MTGVRHLNPEPWFIPVLLLYLLCEGRSNGSGKSTLLKVMGRMNVLVSMKKISRRKTTSIMGVMSMSWSRRGGAKLQPWIQSQLHLGGIAPRVDVASSAAGLCDARRSRLSPGVRAEAPPLRWYIWMAASDITPRT